MSTDTMQNGATGITGVQSSRPPRTAPVVDQELAAMEAIRATIEGLSDGAARKRVCAWMTDRFKR